MGNDIQIALDSR